MSWETKTVMEQREQFVLAASAEDANISELYGSICDACHGSWEMAFSGNLCLEHSAERRKTVRDSCRGYKGTERGHQQRIDGNPMNAHPGRHNKHFQFQQEEDAASPTNVTKLVSLRTSDRCHRCGNLQQSIPRRFPRPV